MSQARSIQPQLLSIEAIIQKSQFKSKILNNVPTDIKKLFLQQLSKPPTSKHQFKRVPLMYEGLYSYDCPEKHSKNHVPPLGYKMNRTKSLNTSKHNNMQTIQIVQTTRTQGANPTNNKKQKKQKKRFSFMQELRSQQSLTKIKNTQKNSNNAQDVKLEQEETKKIQMQSKKSRKKINRIQLVLPGREQPNNQIKNVNNLKPHVLTHESIQNTNKQNAIKNQCNKLQQKQQDLDKVLEYGKNNTIQHNEQQRIKKSRIGFLQKKRYETLSQAVPDFVVAALQQENKKVSPIKNFNMQSCQFFQAIGEERQQRNRVAKLPMNMVNLKKKINYNKIRRSQSSYQNDQVLEPQVNFIRLIQKQKEKLNAFNRKNSQVLNRQRKTVSREKVATFYPKPKARKIRIDEDVKGWDVVADGMQFCDQY